MINNSKTKNMETFNTIDDLLNSDEFNNFFDAEAEKKEIEQTGWNFSALISFGQQLAEKIEK